MKMLEVVEIETGLVVKTIQVAGGDRAVEKTMMGLLRNMNRAKFFVREVAQ